MIKSISSKNRWSYVVKLLKRDWDTGNAEALKIAALHLINALATVPEDLSMRISCRKDLAALNFTKIAEEQHGRSEEFDAQYQLYLDVMLEDELLENQLFESIDISSPAAIIAAIELKIGDDKKVKRLLLEILRNMFIAANGYDNGYYLFIYLFVHLVSYLVSYLVSFKLFNF